MLGRVFILFLFAISLLASFIAGRSTITSSQTSNIEIRNPGKYQFISPLLECDSTTSTSDIHLNDLRLRLNFLVNQLVANRQVGTISIYYRDLNNGPWFGINEDELFSPASLVKIPLLIAYYKLSESDPALLSQKLKYIPQDNPIKQVITPSVNLIPNQEYSIEELLSHMIIYSDNQAYLLLASKFDLRQLLQVYRDLGVDISQAESNPSGNILSAKSYGSFFRVLYNSSYLNKENSEKALKLLSTIEYQKALVSGVPRHIVVSHKFGERFYQDSGEHQLHDCGIVYLPQRPFLVCVMTRGNNLDKLVATIRQVSTTIYDTLK